MGWWGGGSPVDMSRGWEDAEARAGVEDCALVLGAATSLCARGRRPEKPRADTPSPPPPAHARGNRIAHAKGARARVHDGAVRRGGGGHRRP